MAVEQQALVIFPVVGLGIILGLYELILIHRDVNFRGSHWFGHGLHSVIFMAVALFIVMNTEYFLDVSGLAAKDWPFISNVWAVRGLVGFILNIKMHAASLVAKGTLASRGMAEHWTHTILLSLLVVFAPLYWPLLEPLLPSWMGGVSSP